MERSRIGHQSFDGLVEAIYRVVFCSNCCHPGLVFLLARASAEQVGVFAQTVYRMAVQSGLETGQAQTSRPHSSWRSVVGLGSAARA